MSYFSCSKRYTYIWDFLEATSGIFWCKCFIAPHSGGDLSRMKNINKTEFQVLKWWNQSRISKGRENKRTRRLLLEKYESNPTWWQEMQGRNSSKPSCFQAEALLQQENSTLHGHDTRVLNPCRGSDRGSSKPLPDTTRTKLKTDENKLRNSETAEFSIAHFVNNYETTLDSRNFHLMNDMCFFPYPRLVSHSDKHW